MKSNSYFSCTITEIAAPEYEVAITIEGSLVATLYHAILGSYGSEVHIPGFSKGTPPTQYVERNYYTAIIEHIQDFIQAMYINTFLLSELRKKKLVLLYPPELKKAEIKLDAPSTFQFRITALPVTVNQQWRHSNFKPPPRKNYRDLDTQAKTFLDEERAHQEHRTESIEPNDWIALSLKLYIGATEITPNYESLFWLRVGQEETDREARTLFTASPKTNSFKTNAHFFQEYCRALYDHQYTFEVNILQHTPQATFSIDEFRQHFKLKSEKETHRKLIEVFSFRNDVSQRRETAEAALRLMIKNSSITIPHAVVLYEAEQLLRVISRNPDYYVYRSCKDFESRVCQLAEKQIKERAAIDMLAYNENIEATTQDILSYLNLLKRPRTKEFIYFNLPETRINERESLLPQEHIVQACLREKTLNYLIGTYNRLLS